jgi:hypothetical protein
MVASPIGLGCAIRPGLEPARSASAAGLASGLFDAVLAFVGFVPCMPAQLQLPRHVLLYLDALICGSGARLAPQFSVAATALDKH